MGFTSSRYNTSYEKDAAIVRTRLQWGFMIGFIVLLFSFPFYVDSDYWINVLNLAAITLISVLGLNFLLGYCGQISLAQSAFMAIGAYTSALLANKLALPFWVSMPVAGLVAGLVGLIFGFSSLKLKGFYLVMATLAAQLIIMYLISHMSLTGGVEGIILSYAHLGPVVFNTGRSSYFLIMTITVIMVFFSTGLARAKIGRAFIAIRDNDLAAEVMGINLFHYKVFAFFLGCFYAGIAGSMWAYYTGLVHPEQFTLIDSIWQLAMVLVGGMGSIMGSIFGVAFFKVLDLLARDFIGPWVGAVFPALAINITMGMVQIIFGLAIILFVIFEPRGINHRWQILKNYYRLWPFTY